jgi:hypothetical protein
VTQHPHWNHGKKVGLVGFVEQNTQKGTRMGVLIFLWTKATKASSLARWQSKPHLVPLQIDNPPWHLPM